MSVGEAILVELKRNRQILIDFAPCNNCMSQADYIDHDKINADIDAAEKALAEQDVIEILKSYEALKGNQ